MTQTQTLIEQVRAKMDGATDYKIAQALDIPRQTASELVRGNRAADAYTCARIAEILERDPLEIIAQVEAEAARTEKKRQYWRSFFSGMRRKAHVVALSATCGFFAGGLPAGNAEAGPLSTSHNGRLRQQPKRNNAALRGGFFSAVDLTYARRKSRHRARKSACHGTR
jgi:plasmid maintenance system antidote protein VapI